MANLIPNKTDSYVKFFDKERLKKERELIDSWDYEICHQYGMDCLFISQKSNFPKVRPTPIQNDLFFHAYGEISRPEYNEPFATQVYVQFTEDLFAINGFGLNTDLTTTLIFNKTSFALDGALAMADNQTINKTFKFKMEVDESDKYVIINYNGKNIKFKARFNWQDKSVSLIEGELFEFDVDPENYVKPDVLNTFKRRYSAKNFIETAKIFVDCKTGEINPLTGKIKLSGTCYANFVIKNPWKAYSDYLTKITPSVGDLVLLNGIDDRVIKLEITEVESENKTAQGISPLLGSYSFKCTAKPYIADNNASVLHDPITAPTDINAKKLIIQMVLNHDASKVADNISKYEKLYTDEMGFNFTEDDVYGGYDLEYPNGLNNPPNVPVNHQPINSNNRVSYKWHKYENHNVKITDASTQKVIATYTPSEFYSYFKNLMDSNYTDYLNRKWNTDISVDYSPIDDSLPSTWYECIALNVPLWFNERQVTGSTVSAYTEADRRIYQLLNDKSGTLFQSFISANSDFITFTNAAAYDGIPNKYEIPLISDEFIETYLDVLGDKRDAMPIDIISTDVYELSAFTELSISRYVKNPDHNFNLRTDLYDIEQYNLGSSAFADVVKTTTPEYKKWKEINIKKMNGPLIPIYQFENTDKSRLATNGESLFFETTYNGTLYRSEISSLTTDIIPVEATIYNSNTVPLSQYLNWIEADKYGIYFNNSYGNRIKLYGKEKSDDDKLSHLNYENDFSSQENSFILTFKNSKYYLVVQPTDKTYILKANQ